MDHGSSWSPMLGVEHILFGSHQLSPRAHLASKALCAGQSKRLIMSIPIELRAKASGIEVAIVAQIVMGRSTSETTDVTFCPSLLEDVKASSSPAPTYA